MALDRAVAALLVILLSPTAFAAYALDVTSSAPIVLEGEVAVFASDTALRVRATRLSGDLELELLRGEALVVEAREAHAQAPLQPRPASAPLERARNWTHALAASNLTLRLDDEPVYYIVRAEREGTVGFRGMPAARGTPYVLTQSFNDSQNGNLDAVTGHERVAWAWEPGWLFTGAYSEATTPFAGFPLHESSRTRAWMQGNLAILLVGGNVSFTDAAGEPRAYRLGSWSAADDDATGPMPIREHVFRYLILYVEGAAGEGPVGGNWGVAAPEMTWRISDTARWTNASGSWRDETTGVITRFRDESVVASGEFDILPVASPAATSALVPPRYDARGVDTLRVGSATVVVPPDGGNAAATAAVGVGAGVSLLLLARLALVLYTRIKREELLDHPARRAIHDVAHAAPGTPARELQRATGLAWGAFNLHLRALVQGRYLRTERVGHYLLVYPMGAHSPGIPSPAARTVFAAIPADGTPVSVVACRESVGMSRQLMDHHLKSLANRGLVEIGRDERRGERVVARAPEHRQ